MSREPRAVARRRPLARRRTVDPIPGGYGPPEPLHEPTVTSADGSRLHAQVHGPEGAPAVVLVHGWTCSTAFWGPVVRELAADHRVVVYDQRGHGRSPAAGPGGYSTDALADDLEAVLGATLAPGERAVLAGHSMGGMTIMAAADRAAVRERAAGILLCSTGSSQLLAEALVIPLRAGKLRTFAHRVALQARTPLGPVTPLAMRVLKYATMGAASAPEAVAACTRIVHACPPPVRSRWGRVLCELDLDRGLGSLTAPTTVLVGTADRLTPPPHARRLAEALPNCTGLIELPGVGHMTPMEDPETTAAAIRGLVRTTLAGPAGGGATVPAQKARSTGKEATAS
ncbi:alpha/beta fold hydrolase [Streptomyces sp. URMC 123]|uniref:alpha/beta fold hydrolase n=1 Tax=Streptomyces sp. URMC 123 TaxID=3423403 RepID=UPI003F1957B7